MADSPSDETGSYQEAALAYVQTVLKVKRVDASTLARKSGLSPSTVTRFIGAEGDGSRIRLNTLRKIEHWSRVPLPASLTQKPVQSPPVPFWGSKPQGRNTVPIHVLIGSSKPEAFYRNSLATDFAPRLPGIEHAARVFAVRMPDDTMVPWRKVNELVYIDPTRPVAEGDHALIEIGRASEPNDETIHMIRQVLRRRSGEIVLHAWNAADPGLSADDQVLSLRRVLEWPELALA